MKEKNKLTYILTGHINLPEITIKEAEMYKTILVPLDGSELAECVLPYVESMIKEKQVEKVILVRVIETFLSTVGHYGEGISKEAVDRLYGELTTTAEEYLKKIKDRISTDGVEVQGEIIRGAAAESVADFAKENNVDLIAVATHGHSGISRWAVGSTADKILRSSCVPVLMVKAPGCVPGIY